MGWVPNSQRYRLNYVGTTTYYYDLFKMNKSVPNVRYVRGRQYTKESELVVHTLADWTEKQFVMPKAKAGQKNLWSLS